MNYEPSPLDILRIEGHARNFALLALLLALSVRLAGLRPARLRHAAAAAVVALIVWPTVAAPVRNVGLAIGNGVELANAQPTQTAPGTRLLDKRHVLESHPVRPYRGLTFATIRRLKRACSPPTRTQMTYATGRAERVRVSRASYTNRDLHRRSRTSRHPPLSRGCGRPAARHQNTFTRPTRGWRACPTRRPSGSMILAICSSSWSATAPRASTACCRQFLSARRAARARLRTRRCGRLFPGPCNSIPARIYKLRIRDPAQAWSARHRRSLMPVYLRTS